MRASTIGTSGSRSTARAPRTAREFALGEASHWTCRLSRENPRGGGQRGFTLVELLVSATISALIMGGAFVAFSEASRANEAAMLMTGMNSNLQASVDLIVRDFIQVGQGLPNTKVIVLPAGASSAAINRPGPPGTNYTFRAGGTELPAVTSGAGLGPTVGQATDMVTIVYADNQLDPVVCNTTPAGDCTIASDSASLTLSSSVEIDPGDLILFTNGTAAGSAMQMVTSRTGTLPNQTVFFAAGDALNLNQRTAERGNLPALRTNGVFPPTTISRLRMISYYLDATQDPTRLIRRLNADPGRVVAFGIQNLQFSYDLVDGITNPSDVKMNATDLAGGGRCGAAACSPNQIRKINIFLQARSRTKFTRTQRFFNNTLATQVSLRSLAFVDRYQ
jgi:prepilin-type N-terminal cleavage/methylation domain-containing protein